MSIEIFRINENGAGWVDFSEATKDEQMNIELGLMTKQFQMLCFVCHKGIERGNVCLTHKDAKGGIYFE
ncbi:MAG: hypothetical protein ACO25K_06745 [Candidatus Fonsibacter ubiquis]|jgi:hypothetical protein